MRWLYIFNESLQSAYRTITLNKLRTFLSLLGVTIGIFSIISVLTVLDSMKSNMKATVESFGTDVIFVEKWPWAPENGKEFAWWEYLNRPVTTLREYTELKNRMKNVKAVSFSAAIQTDVEYLDNKAENLLLWGVTEEFEQVRSFDIYRGRFFSYFEINSGRNLCVIGYTLAEELFRGMDPLGREIKLQGKEASIIGVFSREGKSFLGGGSMDKVVLIPVKFMAGMADLKDERSNPQIWVKAAEGMTVNELKEEVRITMRSIRRLNPRLKDSFALNETNLLNAGIDAIFKVVNLAGWFIGIFAVLVGAFGIANIMFVSVKERTNIIGIQKALGAKSYYIILEVLYESILLSLVGGIFGLVLIYIGTFIAQARNFDIFLSAGNMVLGIFISTTVGLIAGMMPAFTAARLDPVKAIASTF
jgi:putative ABC transport system permease protein